MNLSAGQFDAASTTGGAVAYSSYAPIYKYLVPAGGYAANGNLLAHSDSVMGDWGFGYDTLNRLTGAAAGNAPTADGAPATWVNSIGCYNYDSFGNRTVAAITTTGDCSSLGAATASYTASNKVSFVSQAAPISYSAPSGFTYDAVTCSRSLIHS